LRARTVVVGECWLWQGSRTPKGGYGIIIIGNRRAQQRRTTCRRGHPRTPEHAVWLGTKWRCVTCKREVERQRVARLLCA
jgi:hypothetical protein